MLLKQKLISKVILTLIFQLIFSLVTFSISNSNELIMREKIEPLCYGDLENYNQRIIFKDIDYIEVKVNNNKKFLSSQLQVLSSLEDDYSKNIKEIKKNYKGYVIINLKKNKTCKFKAKIRVHGDGPDHYDFIDGFPISSMHIELIEGNINNITEFKLFLPASEGGESEIVNSLLFRNLGFLAPRTYNVSIKTNNSINNFLFQEDIRKEMLEYHGKKEGLLLEPANEANFKLFRIKNKKWLTYDINNLLIASKVLALINKEYITSRSQIKKNINNIDINKKNIGVIDFSKIEIEKKFIKKNNLFETLSFATNSELMLWVNDRRFYFNEVLGNFEPIYYDAESYIFDNKKKKKYDSNFITAGAKEEIFHLEEKINQIDIDKFYLDLKNYNTQLKFNEIKDYFLRIKNNLNSMKNKESFENDLLKNENENYINDNINFIFFENKNILICKKNLQNCNFIFENNNKLDQIKTNLIRQDFDKINFTNLNKIQINNLSFIGDKSVNLFNLNDNKLGFRSWKSKKISKNNDIKLYYQGDIFININEKDRIINLNYNNITSNIVLYSANNEILDGWTISMTSSYEVKKKDYTKRLRDLNTNLTGCLNIINLEIKKIKLNSKGSYLCEDVINIINSNGSIENIYLDRSISDSLDIDFSNITINNLFIKNAKNDCLDLSFGNYEINKSTFINCEDKALSIGEKSTVNLQKIYVKDSKIAIAVKDSSILNLNENNFKNNLICLASYRKKQEFSAPRINKKLKINCNTKKNFFQKGTMVNNVF